MALKECKPTQYSGFNDPQTWVIARIVLDQAKEHPKRTAIRFIEGPEWTFAELKNESLKSAAWLQKQGVTIQTRVALMCDDPITFCRCWLGLAMLGCTANYRLNTLLLGASPIALETAVRPFSRRASSQCHYRPVVWLFHASG